MRFTSKALTLLLAAAMLTPVLASCGETADKPQTPDNTDTEAQTEAVTEPVDLHLDTLPDDIDLGGKTIKVLGRMETHAANEVLVDGQNGEISMMRSIQETSILKNG